MARVGKNPGRVAADRILQIARDAVQPRVVVGRARQQAAVRQHHEDALASASAGHLRMGLRVRRDLLRLRGRTGSEAADIQDVIGRGHSLAEGPVQVGAGLLHVPALVGSDLHPHQPAYVVVVRHCGARHYGRHALHVRVADQQGAVAMVIVHLASVGPVGRMGYRSLQTIHHVGNARQDQADLCLQAPPLLVLPLVLSGHTIPHSLCLMSGPV